MRNSNESRTHDPASAETCSEIAYEEFKFSNVDGLQTALDGSEIAYEEFKFEVSDHDRPDLDRSEIAYEEFKSGPEDLWAVETR